MSEYGPKMRLHRFGVFYNVTNKRAAVFTQTTNDSRPFSFNGRERRWHVESEIIFIRNFLFINLFVCCRFSNRIFYGHSERMPVVNLTGYYFSVQYVSPEYTGRFNISPLNI